MVMMMDVVGSGRRGRAWWDGEKREGSGEYTHDCHASSNETDMMRTGSDIPSSGPVKVYV